MTTQPPPYAVRPSLVRSARLLARELDGLIGIGDQPDEANAARMAAAALRVALIEITHPQHRVELTATRGLTDRLLRAALRARQDGKPTELLIGGRRAALIIPATEPGEGDGDAVDSLL